MIYSTWNLENQPWIFEDSYERYTNWWKISRSDNEISFELFISICFNILIQEMNQMIEKINTHLKKSNFRSELIILKKILNNYIKNLNVEKSHNYISIRKILKFSTIISGKGDMIPPNIQLEISNRLFSNIINSIFHNTMQYSIHCYFPRFDITIYIISNTPIPSFSRIRKFHLIRPSNNTFRIFFPSIFIPYLYIYRGNYWYS